MASCRCCFAKSIPPVSSFSCSRALEIYRSLLLLSTPDAPGDVPRNVSLSSCAIVNRVFNQGACAITLDWDSVFPYRECCSWLLTCGCMSMTARCAVMSATV